ncbi:hypothetical protein OB947_22285 [Aeromonas bestiarum]|jgi:hypothetical protein|uniref:hypothetical protein n=1 Tax=Aeromonas bestiarum TaxID=105751 RepID=UPI00259EF427|nr:hypothetical protein [Aeromonas bestiarum]MDM5091606.1 hypothetical protein [Aeromonas bestiarum]
MTTRDVTDTYRQLKALERSITALSELSSLIPAEDDYAALIQVLSDRIETEFEALQGDLILTWNESAKPVKAA